MSWIARRVRAALAPLTAVTDRIVMDERLDEEMEHHIEMQTRRYIRAGLSSDEARRRALVAFGGRRRFQEEARETYRSRRLEELTQDIRHTARMVRRAPGFTAAVVLSLALGVGATTVIFSVADHVALRPLPYADPERLVLVREHIEELDELALGVNASHFLEWQRVCTACAGMAAIRPADAMTLTGDGEPEFLGALRVSPTLFPMLGVTAALGRLFVADDDQPDRNVVVLTDAFWRRRFGADPSIVGRSIMLRRAPWTVIGVLPPGFWFPKRRELGGATIPDPVHVFVPLALTPRERATPGEFDYAVIARLGPGAMSGQLRSQLAAVQAAFSERASEKMTLRADVTPLHEQIVGPARRGLMLLLAAVGAVLLIVCVNLANLLLARNAGRLRESAVRVALGADRARLVRQALTESAVLAMAGGVLGVMLSRWGLAALLALAPADLPRLSEVRLDGRVLAVGLLVSILAGMAFGTLPAFRFGRADPAEALKAGGRGSTDARRAVRGRALLIASQTGFSTLLLVVAGLFLSSFVRVLRVDKGFQVERLLAMNINVQRPTFPDRAARTRYFDEALTRVASIPGVTATALATSLPLEGEWQVDDLVAENDTRPNAVRPTANIRSVSGGYFRAVGTPLRRGRTFADSDRGHNVVVLSERAAQVLWPGEDPIGKRVFPGSNDSVSVVIGVVADVRTSSLEKEGSLVAYIPYWQNVWGAHAILVRTTGDPAALTAAVRSELRAIDPRVAVRRVRTMAQIMSAAVAQRRFQVALLALFAFAALATASIGIYGIISHTLSRRRSEIGIRMALGARPFDVHRLVLREGLQPVVTGLLVGTIASVLIGRTFASLLFEVRPSDPLTLGAVAILLVVVAAVACLVPARRATGMGAAEVLRLD